ncbi:unnamed protein product [Cylicostephanus goldi]|uniref:Uncharacterized protein n=1 Tax=Cylicostephanus goldi TaxID=71465 RepID=A0A3P6SJ98_CYLGO|nr:unnamed protein product [Cylicostephanus goldi]
MLFDVGKKPETISRRRRKLYDLVKRFEVAAKGGDPYSFEIPVPEIVLTSNDYKEAEERLQKMNEEVALERKRMKLEKKRMQSESQNVANDDGENVTAKIRPKKSAVKRKVLKRNLGRKHAGVAKRTANRKAKLLT